MHRCHPHPDPLAGTLRPFSSLLWPRFERFATLPGVADHDEWLDVDAAARYLSLPASTIRRLIRHGQLATLRFPVRVRRQELDACLDRCRIKPGDLSYASQGPPRRPGDPPSTRKGVPDRRYGPRYSAGAH